MMISLAGMLCVLHCPLELLVEHPRFLFTLLVSLFFIYHFASFLVLINQRQSTAKTLGCYRRFEITISMSIPCYAPPIAVCHKSLIFFPLK